MDRPCSLPASKRSVLNFTRNAYRFRRQPLGLTPPLKVSAPSCRGGVALCSTGVGTSTASRARSREATMASTLVGKQAVVVGAGMGGLTAAGAVADFFDQVVVLERDTLPSEPAHRAGTPQ